MQLVQRRVLLAGVLGPPVFQQVHVEDELGVLFQDLLRFVPRDVEDAGIDLGHQQHDLAVFALDILNVLYLVLQVSEGVVGVPLDVELGVLVAEVRQEQTHHDSRQVSTLIARVLRLGLNHLGSANQLDRGNVLAVFFVLKESQREQLLKLGSNAAAPDAPEIGGMGEHRLAGFGRVLEEVSADATNEGHVGDLQL